MFMEIFKLWLAFVSVRSQRSSVRVQRSSVRVQRSSVRMQRSSLRVQRNSVRAQRRLVVVRWPAAWQARIRNSARHLREVFFPLSNKQWRNRERTNVLYEYDYKGMKLKHIKINKKNGSIHQIFNIDVKVLVPLLAYESWESSITE